MPDPKPLSPSAKEARTIYLLTCLFEEATEVAKEVSKILRFGLHNTYHGLTPKQRLTTELMDMSIILEELENMGIGLFDPDNPEVDYDAHAIIKRERLEAAYEDSRKNGLIKPD